MILGEDDMFVYMFHNDLFVGQYRKVVLSFPMPQSWKEGLRKDGWYEVDVFYLMENIRRGK